MRELEAEMSHRVAMDEVTALAADGDTHRPPTARHSFTQIEELEEDITGAGTKDSGGGSLKDGDPDL